MTNEKSLIEQILEVVRRQGELMDSELIDAANHGAGGGFNGFIYYHETLKFHDDNVDLIDEFLFAEMEEFGGFKNVAQFIGSWRHDPGALDSDQGRKNQIAWYCLERAGQYLQDCVENAKELSATDNVVPIR